VANQPTLKEKTAKGILWGGVSSGTVQVMSMLFGLYLSRTLAVEDYGLVAMLAIFTAIANTVITSGFTVALTNKREATHEDFNAVFWFTTFVSLIVYVILFFSAPLIARFFGHPELIPIGRVLFLSFVFGGVASVSHTVLFKQLLVKIQARIDIISVLISGIVGVLMAYFGMGYWALVIQTVLYVAVNSIIKLIIAPWHPTLQINLSPLRNMFSFSIKLFLTNAFIQINRHVFSVILGKMFGEYQSGLYAQGQKWMDMATNTLTGMINAVAHPVLVQVRDEKERLLNVFRKMLRFAAFVSFPAMFGLAFVANEFILITIGEKWLPSVPILQTLCILGTLYPIWHLYTYVLITHGKSNLFLIGNVIHGLLLIAALLITARWGIYWMVVAYVGTYFISFLYWHYYAHRLIGISVWQLLKDVMPYLGITLLVLFATYIITLPLQNIYLLLIGRIGIAVILYIVIMKLTNSVIFRESMDFLLKKKRK